MTKINIFIDNDLENLKQQAQKLEDILAEKQTELLQLEHNLQIFSMEYNDRICDLYLTKLSIDVEINKLIQKKNFKYPNLVEETLAKSKYISTYISEDQFQKTSKNYKKAHNEFAELTKSMLLLTDTEEKLLKKIRKKLLMKYHPDKHHNNEKLYAKATAITQSINQFYFDKNLVILKEMLNKNLRKDTFEIPDTFDELQNIIESFKNSITKINDSIVRISNDPLYNLYIRYSDFVKIGAKEDFYGGILSGIQLDIDEAKKLLSELSQIL